MSFTPQLIINSGRPFNIITGQDTNRDNQFTERPTYAQLNAKCIDLGLTNDFCVSAELLIRKTQLFREITAEDHGTLISI